MWHANVEDRETGLVAKSRFVADSAFSNSIGKTKSCEGAGELPRSKASRLTPLKQRVQLAAWIASLEREIVKALHEELEALQARSAAGVPEWEGVLLRQEEPGE